MARIRITTPTNLMRFGVIGLSAWMLSFAVLNIFFSFTPITEQNLKIEIVMADAAHAMSATELLTAQIKALMRKPAEPFAWQRLAYLRRTCGGDRAGAFAALRMSDLVSPGEPRQILERALLWREYRDVETKGEQDYQSVLWQKAFMLQKRKTSILAVQMGLTEEIGDALQADPDLYSAWRALISKN